MTESRMNDIGPLCHFSNRSVVAMSVRTGSSVTNQTEYMGNSHSSASTLSPMPAGQFSIGSNELPEAT